MPGAPVSISDATITSHAIPIDSRKPVNMYGKVAGIITLRINVQPRSRSTRATFRYSALMLRTPTAVLTTVGHIAQIAIVNSAAGSERWKTIRPIGSHANGEIGRNTWITGSKARLNPFDSPSRKPSGVPSSTASEKPFATRTRLKIAKRPMPWFISPSLKNGRSTNGFDSCHVCHGDGRSGATTRLSAIHTVSTVRMPTSGIRAACRSIRRVIASPPERGTRVMRSRCGRERPWRRPRDWSDRRRRRRTASRA